MMKFVVAAMVLGAAAMIAPAHAEEKPASSTTEAPKAAFSTAATPIGEILDNVEAKAVVEKHLPGFSSHPQIEMARGFSLKAVQSFSPEMITDELLAKIDADFAALTAALSS